MTPERAKELLPLWQAYADGKTVQFRQPQALDEERRQWSDYTRETTDPYYFVCAGPYLEWRVKPEPREWWACEKCGQRICTLVDYTPKTTTYCCNANFVHVREVLPEK